VIFRHLQQCPDGPEPIGAVLPVDLSDPACLSRGRVVFAQPVLLPEEQFVPLELLQSRSQRFAAGRRTRLQIPRPGR